MQTDKYKISEQPEENLIQQLISKYFPYWPIFLLTMGMAIGLAYTYLYYSTPIYEALIYIDKHPKRAEDILNQPITSYKQSENEKMRWLKYAQTIMAMVMIKYI